MAEKEQFDKKTRLAGVAFEGRQDNINKYAKINSKYRLKRDPENEFDTNAVMVTSNGKDIGFLPSYLAQEVAPMIDAGKDMKVHLRRKLINEKDSSKPVGVIVRVWEDEKQTKKED